MNTVRDAVIGSLEGSSDTVKDVKKWLNSMGGSKSKIENAEFRNERKINTTSCNDFRVRRYCYFFF